MSAENSSQVQDDAQTNDAKDAVLVQSEALPEDTPRCEGHSFAEYERTGKVDYEALLRSYATTGFQATSFAQACDAVRAMVRAFVRASQASPVKS